jgi:putative membrane protein
MRLLVRWVVSAAAVWVAAYLVPCIRLEEGLRPLLVVALILGLVNALGGPLVRALAGGLIFLTMRLILLVINAGLLLLAARLAREAGVAFYVDGFGAALAGAIVISVVSFLLSLLLPDGDGD